MISSGNLVSSVGGFLSSISSLGLPLFSSVVLLLELLLLELLELLLLSVVLLGVSTFTTLATVKFTAPEIKSILLFSG